jgi:hypothetical protein
MREVVGVVGDIKRRGLTAQADPQYYLPYAQSVITNPFLTIRTIGDPSSVENELRAVLREMDKSVPVYQVSTLETYVSKSVAQPRFQTLLLSCFAAIALMLSAIGLYGLLSYMVVQRTLEIGLRMALGAQRTDVLRMIVRRGLTLALIGLVAGPGDLSHDDAPAIRNVVWHPPLRSDHLRNSDGASTTSKPGRKHSACIPRSTT